MLDKQRLRTFVLGGLAGALAGVLFAPRSGKELRGTITSRAGEARERGRETYFDAQERMQERVSRVSERPPRSGEPEEAHAFRDDSTEPLPDLETGPLVDPSTGISSGPAPLRDVSWDAPRSAPRDVAEEYPEPVSKEEPEELRRRIQETRSRLRARLEGAEETPKDPNV